MIYDALVAGGGPAGSAVAIDLARGGRRVVLIERETEPHDKVCGEFLSFEANHYLARLGIDPEALGGVPLQGVRLVHGRRPATSALPFKALSLSRRILDEALLQKAALQGVEVRRGVRVKSLMQTNALWSASVEQGLPVTARTAFLATGKHDLKDLKRGPGLQGDLIGFKMYWRLTSAQANDLHGHVELALFPGGYAGLQPVEGGRANLCLLVRRYDFAGTENSFDTLLAHIKTSCPHLAQRLEGAVPVLAKPLAISSIPYGYIFQPAETGPNDLWRLGDQAAVIPSFSGDGMAIALHSARLAAYTYLIGKPAQVYHTNLAQDVRRQIKRSTRVSRALVTPWGQRGAAGLAAVAPVILTGLAAATRISKSALRRADVGA
ncbi:MAG: NAD(P)/FAD-dependent oxidoreductase [Hyphomicrobium sp.]